MAAAPLVYVVILNWNGWQDTLACVASCRKLTWPNFRILVVDNGSTDGSEAILRERLQDVEILQSGANLGFAGGNNVGIRHALKAGADYVWLLNNDAEAGPEALTELVGALEADTKAGMASSKIYYHGDPRRIWSAGGLWEGGRLRWRMLGANQLDRGQFDQPGERGTASGCSVLVRARMIEEIGPMDEEYFLYWEDTEWCARAQKEGYTLLFAPTSHVWHKVSSSTREASFSQHYYSTRNGLYFLSRQAPLWALVFSANTFFSCVRYVLSGNTQPFRGFLRGCSGFLQKERGPMPER